MFASLMHLCFSLSFFLIYLFLLPNITHVFDILLPFYELFIYFCVCVFMFMCVPAATSCPYYSSLFFVFIFCLIRFFSPPFLLCLVMSCLSFFFFFFFGFYCCFFLLFVYLHGNLFPPFVFFFLLYIRNV
ncbi:hypothetical protein, unlikely [Trypanosoma brucei gambiense DAL972]|uniref:Uncharacterized protein n=1 Tax=Trypanosoma brucei gambiense (strain MHOM/CI/86/DAL972) TaxID=679716 RepID=D0A123_TRYB9|nr:hypothetical protein, unlikely [Trypanosoma brucei gambiense DAL972]CBH14965.1 hypothetical protein, unlikely [Trypanosoma brucei gambiense DAL972]|eukprot:XP_011777231.1 hypothetical protein, unlikely [Trypanosoma brucei gambiense DAL972]